MNRREFPATRLPQVIGNAAVVTWRAAQLLAPE